MACMSNCFIPTQVAAMLLKRYKEKFSGHPLGATWGYLRQMARDSLPPNPQVSHDTQPTHHRDPAFLVKTLRYELVTLTTADLPLPCSSHQRQS